MPARIPQLRIAVTSGCTSRCVYCRPGGESTALSPREAELTPGELAHITALMVRRGLTHIKLTGGEPMLRDDIVDVVTAVRNVPGVKSIHLVTQHPRAGDLADDLYEAGVEVLNFSLDSLAAATWESISRVKGHQALVAAVLRAARKQPRVKISAVMMKGINDHEVPALVELVCGFRGELKLLDLIPDIVASSDDDPATRHYMSLETVIDWLRTRATSERVVLQPGGLGHPMQHFTLPGGATVTVKSLRSGAWYSDTCRDCDYFPCHDAIMALRLTSGGQLQRCLVRDDNLLDLGGAIRRGARSRETDEMIGTALRTYAVAEFYSYERIEELRRKAETGKGVADAHC